MSTMNSKVALNDLKNIEKKILVIKSLLLQEYGADVKIESEKALREISRECNLLADKIKYL